MLVCLNREVPEIDTNALAITLRHHPRLRRIASKENVHPLPVAVCVPTQDSLQLDYLQAETLRSKRRAVSTKKSQQEKCTRTNKSVSTTQKRLTTKNSSGRIGAPDGSFDAY
jgi:hypothetical protein